MIFRIKDIVAKTIYLFLGFLGISLGVVLGVKSNLGLAPWDVFHQGLAIVFNSNIGIMSMYVGIAVIFVAAAIKVYPGIGAVLNTVVIAIMIDMIMPYAPDAIALWDALIMNIVGVVLLSLGTVLYLKANLGAGPRDSLLLGLMQRFNMDTKYVKPIMEGVVLLVGFLLGGTFGIGTFFCLFLMGYFMDVFFKIFKYDPIQTKQMNFLEQWHYLKGAMKHESSSS